MIHCKDRYNFEIQRAYYDCIYAFWFDTNIYLTKIRSGLILSIADIVSGILRQRAAHMLPVRRYISPKAITAAGAEKNIECQCAQEHFIKAFKIMFHY